MSADMEMSCDERVLNEMGSKIKQAYSTSLLSLATGRRLINGSPHAFGEGNVKGRIKDILNFKKPAAWVIGSFYHTRRRLGHRLHIEQTICRWLVRLGCI